MATSTVKYIGNLRCEAVHLASGTSILSDAPVDNHGKGEAFSPTDLTATSLASCIITTMAIGAEGRDISIRDMSAEVTKVMASNPRRIAEINIRLVVIAHGVTDQQKEILTKIANTCPVALSLHPDVKQGLEIIFG